MQEALLLFESLLSSIYYKYSRIILLFTKLDLFEEKIKQKPLADYFPDFAGPINNSSAALSFLTDKFVSLNQQCDRTVEVHYIDTTNEDQVRIFLKGLEKTVLEGKGHVWGKISESYYDSPMGFGDC